MALVPVTDDEVDRIISGFNSKSSTDINYLSVQLIKHCYRHILTPLTKILNSSFVSGHFPTDLKVAKITPIFKTGDPSLPENYSPTSILSVLSVFEKAFLYRLLAFFDKFQLLVFSKDQFGFREKLSSVDAIISLCMTLRKGRKGKKHVIGVFLDLSKALDCVHHATL